MSYTRPEDAIYQPLTVDGTPRGAYNLIGDYRVTPGVVYYEATVPVVLTRMFPYIADAGSFDSGGYGNGAALTNGITLKIVESDGTVVLDMIPHSPVKTNTDWKALCYDITLSTFGLGDETFGARWTFGRDTADDGLLLSDGRRLELTCNDNHTNLAGHQFLIRGYLL